MRKPLTKKRAVIMAHNIRAQYEGYKEQGMLAAAKYILLYAVEHPEEDKDDKTLDYAEAENVVRSFIKHLLNNNQFEAAAVLMWGKQVFNYEPKSVRDVWRCCEQYDKLLIPGSGAMGKSYNVGAKFYLEWWKDPEYTCIKVVSATKEHAKTNIFASMQNFHRLAILRPKGCESHEAAESIKCNSDEKQGIHLMAIAKGESGAGVLRGFHPVPRQGEPHPEFGILSRVFALLDEAEAIPFGCWEGVNNIASTIDSSSKSGQIKIVAASNPKNRASDFGQRCEPVGGWTMIDKETDLEWTSKEGYHVLRLDAAQSENVIQKKMIYEGFQTYDGYMAYLQAGRTAESDTMARGWFPAEGTAMCIITPAMFDNSIGIYRFIGPVVPLTGIDLALEGNDNMVAAHGRFGLVDGWTPQSGKIIAFNEPRVGLQLDGLVMFPKVDTVKQTNAIKDFCKTMRIKPGWCCVDRTGNGSGVHDCLRNDIHFGEDVMGVNYGEAATDSRVMADDAKTCQEQYDGIVTELIFALARFLEFGYIKISPSFRNEELSKQCVSRRYKQKGKGLNRVEPKKEYMHRLQAKSPDAMDAVSLMVHLFRMKSGEIGSMTPQKPPQREDRQREQFDVGKLDFIDFSGD